MHKTRRIYCCVVALQTGGQAVYHESAFRVYECCI